MGVIHSTVATGADDPTKEINKGEWNDDHIVGAASADRVLFVDAGGVITDSANFNYTETSGPRLQVGSGTTTNVGVVFGYSGLSGNGAIWPSLASSFDYTTAWLWGNATSTALNAAAAGDIQLRFAGTQKFTFFGTAGRGASLDADAATTDVQALSVTQTWNAAGVTFTSLKYAISDTASAAGSMLFQFLGGATGTTNLLKLIKDGELVVGTATAQGSEGVTGVYVRGMTQLYTGAGGAIYWQARSVMLSPSDGVIGIYNQAQTDFGRLQFGGTTSSFPALLRDAAGLRLVTADNTTGTFLSFIEQTAPAAPSANGVRIFAQDNGSGKTQLMVIFGSGAAQQLAIEV